MHSCNLHTQKLLYMYAMSCICKHFTYIYSIVHTAHSKQKDLVSYAFITSIVLKKAINYLNAYIAAMIMFISIHGHL